MLSIKSLIVCALSLLLITACATTSESTSGTFGQKISKSGSKKGSDTDSKIYYGKWTLVKIIDQNGDIRDFTNEPANYVHIKEHEIAEVMHGYGVKTYNYMEKDNTFIIMSGNRLSTWKLVKSSQNSLEIETSAGRYILVRS